MRDYYMVLVIIVIFVGGYLASGGLDSFMKKNRRLSLQKEHPHYQWMHIGIENIDLLEEISEQLANGSKKLPYLEIFTDRKSKDELLKDLKEERLDVAVLADAPEEHIPQEYQSIRIPKRIHPHADAQDQVQAPSEINTHIVLIWNTRMEPDSIEYVRNLMKINGI